MRTSLLSLLTVALACVRSVHASCAGLPANSSDSPSGQFTLAAFNPTTNTSTPLYVHQIGASGYSSYSVVIASATPDTYFGSITLTNGHLNVALSNPPVYPIGATISIGNTNANYAQYSTPPAGVWPTFATNYAHGTNVPPIYCSVPGAGSTGVPLLASNGTTGAWALCKSYITSSSSTFNALTFGALPYEQPFGEYTYDGSTCVPVQVLLVPA